MAVEEKDAAVRIVRTLRAELGTAQGTVSRVACQLGYGLESVRSWVCQADIDEVWHRGCRPMNRAKSASSSRLSENSSMPTRFENTADGRYLTQHPL
jgi:hypothetical protein